MIDAKAQERLNSTIAALSREGLADAPTESSHALAMELVLDRLERPDPDSAVAMLARLLESRTEH